MLHFEFTDHVDRYHSDQYFRAQIATNISSKEKLFIELANKLLLPDYFGFNWDALRDCLADFHWIQNRAIVLIRTEVPNIDEGNLKTYLALLNDAIQDWQASERLRLAVAFPKSSEHTIKELTRL